MTMTDFKTMVSIVRLKNGKGIYTNGKGTYIGYIKEEHGYLYNCKPQFVLLVSPFKDLSRLAAGFVLKGNRYGSKH